MPDPTLANRVGKFKHECRNCHKIFYGDSQMYLYCSEECELEYKAHELKNWEEKVKKAHQPIRDIAKAATKAGLTYGEYVARYMKK